MDPTSPNDTPPSVDQDAAPTGPGSTPDAQGHAAGGQANPLTLQQLAEGVALPVRIAPHLLADRVLGEPRARPGE